MKKKKDKKKKYCSYHTSKHTMILDTNKKWEKEKRKNSAGTRNGGR